MRVIITGAGLVGTQLAQHLVSEKHDVSIIESNADRARHASNRLDCLVLQDEGNSVQALKEAGIAKADALVCVTGSDEVNLITCGLAESLKPGLLTIARVRNDDYARLTAALGGRVLGIDHFIHPDVEAAKAALGSLSHGAVGNVLSFQDSPYELGSVAVAAGSPLEGLCLRDYRSVVKGESLIILVERGEETLLPSGDTVLEGGDRVHVLAPEAEMDSIFSLAGRAEKPLRRIGIVGGGRLGSLIAEGLLSPEGGSPGEAPGGAAGRVKSLAGGFLSFLKSFLPGSSRRVTIIEQDHRVCKDLAARFPGALVLNEDISDESFVAEERIGSLDLIITATANQELNMIAALYLKSRGVRRAIAMVSGSGYEAIARGLGVDVVIPLKSVVVDSIISHLMGRGIKGVHRLGDGSVGVIEIEIAWESPAAEKPITALKLSAGGLVMLVNRGGESFIPRGNYVFRPGDHIVLAAKNGSEGEIEKFFGAQM